MTIAGGNGQTDTVLALPQPLSARVQDGTTNGSLVPVRVAGQP
ncbi:MAG TPA: hypothetical protein VLT17_02195 [Gemmatimonadales bacterium]|nr:hypothetical protein [Gemmatimonadales bacterium]